MYLVDLTLLLIMISHDEVVELDLPVVIKKLNRETNDLIVSNYSLVLVSHLSPILIRSVSSWGKTICLTFH